MLQIMVLICPMAIDRLHCDPSNAVSTIRGMKVSSAQQCAFMGQAMIAPTALKPGPDQHMIIWCPRAKLASRE